ncbi:MAG: 23S rRNA (adenine(2503)-C(2))-methyltransferase RlmN [Bdellovibrio sp.]|nr:MAG: 23S rRNA (adenine(2503)-C(2))-methyltransferase RlmN [Bdellovibrio sp.]
MRVQRMEKNFYQFRLPELESYFQEIGEKKFRATQLFKWVYGRGIVDFQKMTDISKTLRERLPQMLSFHLPPMQRRFQSKDGTRKYLFDVGDGYSVESVLIPSKDRLTLCVSSEVGCNLACRFCLTGTQKLKKKLDMASILGQYVAVSKELRLEGKKITNIVFMGMGEPLDNEENVFRAIEILHNPLGFNLSRKKITVSTAGLVPKIPLVTKAGVRLAVSLNGTTDEIRSYLMPINKKWSLMELLAACKKHAEEARDKVTFEYVLIKGLTDSLRDADRLYDITKDIPCKINIIPFNEHPGAPELRRPSEEQINAFQQRLIKKGVHVLRRRTMGDDIFAACGQLTSAQQREKIF